MAIKTAKELVAACLDVVNNYKTLYVMGCFGAPMTAANKARYTKNHSFNAQADRKAKIEAASEDTFGFDCIGLIKGLLWEWHGDVNHTYGGAIYQSNGVYDLGTEQLLNVCSDISDDFTTIVPGELVWQPGHAGIYIGEGKAVECTEYEADGVQIQAVLPMGYIEGLPCTGWKKHGKLPYVSYEEEVKPEPIPEPIPEAKPEEPKEEATPAAPKLYRVTIEGMTKGFADNTVRVFSDGGYTVILEEMVEETETMAKEPAEPDCPTIVPNPPAVFEPEAPKEEAPWQPQVGDKVFFHGDTHYSSAYLDIGKPCDHGEATITHFVPCTKHPYHLIRTGNNGPWGWVNAGTFDKV